MTKIFFAAASILALAAVGCAAETDTSTPDDGVATSSEADALRGKKHPPVAHEGDQCGGFIRNAPVCAKGLKCVLRFPADLGGECYPEDAVIARLGEHCGGFIRNAPVCAPDLTCKLSLPADLGGTCVHATN